MVLSLTSRVLLVTFKAPRELIEEADKLVEAGIFSSRSEVLRYALSMLIMKYRRLEETESTGKGYYMLK